MQASVAGLTGVASEPGCGVQIWLKLGLKPVPAQVVMWCLRAMCVCVYVCVCLLHGSGGDGRAVFCVLGLNGLVQGILC